MSIGEDLWDVFKLMAWAIGIGCLLVGILIGTLVHYLF